MTLSLSPTGRYVFTAIALGTLLIGAVLFFLPHNLATLPAPANTANPWFWPIGPLAVRFVGSALIAIALSASLVALRPDRPSMLAYATGDHWHLAAHPYCCELGENRLVTAFGICVGWRGCIDVDCEPGASWLALDTRAT